MSGATTRYGLPYPTSGDPVVVHADVQALAEKADIEIGAAVEALASYAAARALLVVDAPEPGLWIVGTDWRGRALNLDAQGLQLIDVDAPWDGTWLTGTDWRGQPLGAATTQRQTVDVARHMTDRGLITIDRDGVARRLTSDPTTVAVYGASFVYGHPRPPYATDGSNSWPGVLASLWPAGTVHNRGIPSSTLEQTAIRADALGVYTAAPIALPADTSPVPMPVETVFSINSTANVPGVLGGIPVVAKPATDGTWTVNRTTAGTAETIPAGTRFIADGATPDAVHVFQAGYNDVFGLTEANFAPRLARVLASFTAMRDRLTPAYPAYLVIGSFPQADHTSGTIGHRFVTTLNAALDELFPGHTWDIATWITQEAIYELGMTPTSADLVSMAGGAIPASITTDNLHYTPAVAALIAEHVHTELTQRGFIS